MKNEKMKKMSIRKRIIFLRKTFGMTQNELASAVGKPRIWIAHLESKRPLSLKSAVILAEYFNITLDLLILGKGK